MPSIVTPPAWPSMRKLAELRVLLLLAAVLVTVALLGRAAAPPGTSRDPRLSTRLTGPLGASAFREALTRLGIDVAEWRKPLFELGRGAPPDTGVLFTMLEPAGALTRPEVGRARDWLAHGGHLLLAGETGIEGCLGYGIEHVEGGTPAMADISLIPPMTPDKPPVPRATLHRLDAEQQGKITRCRLLAPDSIERLWLSGRWPGALRLHFRSGGSALIIADAEIFRNRTLRNTDAGPLLMEWLFARRPRAIIVDEYHQGFGRSASLPGAVIGRVWNTPAGWLLVQLLVAGALFVALAAVRFGPERPAISARRRSPLEHLDALASGLERTKSTTTAVSLILAGLTRRLGGRQSSVVHRQSGSGKRLTIDDSRLTTAQPGAQVMNAANQVEDMWESLKTTRTRS
jgi:hypothetical protein